MGLDLYHHIAVHPSDKTFTETLNVSEFPQEFLDKFADFLYVVPTDYIDWEATFQELMQMSAEEVFNEYDLGLQTPDDVYHFLKKDVENPWEEPGCHFTVVERQLKIAQVDNFHINLGHGGGSMRGCMAPEFFDEYKPFTVLINKNDVSKMSKFCENADCMEMFIENFIANWEENSFLIAHY